VPGSLFSNARATYWALGGGGGGVGAEPFAIIGGGGVGAEPFAIMGGGGVGAEPFAIMGGGGVGAEPFAIITAPSFCAATTVFRLMAPARTSMARSIEEVSLGDIKSASEAVEATEHSIYNYTNVN
jgi:hypothetical protein